MSHNLNQITIELTSGKDLEVRTTEGNKWGTVFGLHNIYKGENEPEETVAYSVSLGANTINLAEKTIAKTGSTFVVVGKITGVGKANGDKPGAIFVRADQLKPCFSGGKEPAAPGGKAAGRK